MNVTKKAIGIVVILLTLTSCGAKPSTPEEVLQQNQTSLIKNLGNGLDYSIDKGVSEGKLNIALEAKEGKGTADFSYNLDFDNKAQALAGDIKINLEAIMDESSASPVKEASGSIDLNLVTLKNKLIFKLNSLDFPSIEKDPQLGAFMGMLAPFKEKWYFINLPETNRIKFNQADVIKNYKEIIASVKNNTLFKQTLINGNKDFYDYNVIIDEEAVVKITTEINKILNSETPLTKEEIADVRANVVDMNKNLEMNLKINKDDLEYFVFTVREGENSFVVENTSKNLNITFDSKKEGVYVLFKGLKTKSKIEGNLSIKENSQEIFSGIVGFKIDKLKSSFNLDGVSKKGEEELRIKLDFSNENKKKDVKIEEPKDITDLQEAIASFMQSMMGPAQLEAGDEGSQIYQK